MSSKIQSGYGTGRRGTAKKGLYGSRSNGKVNHNGGFNRQPTVTYTSITDERWDAIDWSK